jgi:NADH-quinone oxidoreductase subunit L
VARPGAHFTEQSLGLELGLMALSVAGAIGCWALARSRYGAGRSPNWAAEERTLPGFTLLQNKYYVDEIYQGSIVKWFMALRLVLADMDTWIVDGLVNGLAVLVRLVSWINAAIDHYLVDGLVNFVAEGTLAAGAKLRTMQTGRIQNYVYGLLGGVAFFALVQYFLR